MEIKPKVCAAKLAGGEGISRRTLLYNNLKRRDPDLSVLYYNVRSGEPSQTNQEKLGDEDSNPDKQNQNLLSYH